MGKVEAEKVPSSPIKKEGLLQSLQEKHEPSLGELNPLLFSPNLERPETIEALMLTIKGGLEKYEGLKPDSIGVTKVLEGNKYAPRLVIRWEMSLLTEKQVFSLEDLVTETYKPKSVTTRKSPLSRIHRRKPGFWPKIEKTFVDRKTERFDFNTIGWAFGPEDGEADHSTEGLFLFRQINNKSVANSMRADNNHDWFTLEQPVDYRGRPIQTKHIAEIRINDLRQTELVKFILQTARILNGKEPLPSWQFTYELYQTLNRLGLKKCRKEDIHGLDEAISFIEKYLFFPLSKLDETSKRKINVSSVLLVGMPGTGKTLLAEYFLQQDLGIFLVPVPGQTLAKDIEKKGEIIDRISAISKEMGIPVVLQVDDIESIAQESAAINTTLMNLMAGVRKEGFLILASTNKPEELSSQLLQPERFGLVLHIPLPDEPARLGILKVHAPQNYFANPQEKEVILQAVANLTDKFDSRLLKAVCDLAQISAMRRDSCQALLTVEDFEESLQTLLPRFNKNKVVKREEELLKFTNNHKGITLGFQTKTTATEINLAALVKQIQVRNQI